MQPALLVGGYLRISDADLTEIRRSVKLGVITPEEGAELERKGVLKQRNDVLELAARHGFSPSQVIFYEDNNLSAFVRSVRRDDFERLVKDLARSHICGFFCYDIDRGFRQPRDLERVIDIYEASKTPMVFATLSGQNFDLSTADGRFSARLYVNIANKSSEDTSRRIKRENKRKAANGEYHGGTPAYGWLKEDRTKADPRIKKELERVATSFVGGDKLATVTRRYAEAGFINPNTGKPFSDQSFRKVLVRPRNAGIRVYLGESQRRDNGEYIMGDWEPLFSVDLHEAILATLEDRQRPHYDATTKYLLSRIIRCGRCGYKMRGAPRWQKGVRTDTYTYTCERRFQDSCGAMNIAGPSVDELIRELVWSQLERSTQGRTQTTVAAWDKESELQEVMEEIQDLQALWQGKKIKATTYAVTLEDLEDRRDALKAEKSLATIQPKTAVIDPSTIREKWSGLSLERQREVVRTVLKTAFIHPAKSRGARFDPSRVEPVFHS